jgi:formylmethanofuran dehydrogenase subunit C
MLIHLMGQKMTSGEITVNINGYNPMGGITEIEQMTYVAVTHSVPSVVEP